MIKKFYIILFLLFLSCASAEKNDNNADVLAITEEAVSNEELIKICEEWKLGTEINILNLNTLHSQFLEDLGDYNMYQLTDQEFENKVSKYLYRAMGYKGMQSDLVNNFPEIQGNNLITHEVAVDMFEEAIKAMENYKIYIQTKSDNSFNTGRSYLDNAKDLQNLALQNLLEKKSNCNL